MALVRAKGLALAQLAVPSGGPLTLFTVPALHVYKVEEISLSKPSGGSAIVTFTVLRGAGVFDVGYHTFTAAAAEQIAIRTLVLAAADSLRVTWTTTAALGCAVSGYDLS